MGSIITANPRPRLSSIIFFHFEEFWALWINSGHRNVLQQDFQKVSASVKLSQKAKIKSCENSWRKTFKKFQDVQTDLFTGKTLSDPISIYFAQSTLIKLSKRLNPTIFCPQSLRIPSQKAKPKKHYLTIALRLPFQLCCGNCN